MSNVPLLDFAFLAFESEASPKHVAGLQIFKLPRDASADFIPGLIKNITKTKPDWPFNQRLQTRWIGLPQWVEADDFDFEDHVFLESLPKPATTKVLLDRVAEIHANKLDRSGPLWKLYFFENLKTRRFATYFKVHHGYMDGISLSKRAMETLSKSSDPKQATAIWGLEPKKLEETRKSVIATLFGTAKTAGKAVFVVPTLAKLGLKHGLRLLNLSGRELPVPFTAPRTVFNKPLTPERAVAVTDFSLARVHSVAEHAGVTVNDVLLELCDSAMTRYLDEHDTELDKPLIAQMPISLRKGDGGQGNQITIALLELGSDETNAIKRLQRIHTHAQDAKDEYTGMSEEAAEIYTLLLQSVAQLGESTGLGKLIPPLGNVVISSVRGPSHKLYMSGAPLQALYPISTIAPGMAINITVFTYNKTLHVGIVTGLEAISDPQLLTRYMHAALDDLESVMGLSDPAKTKRKKKKTTKKTRRKTRSATKSKSKGAH